MRPLDFGSLSKEQREEWRRQEITSAAVSMLREAETVAAVGVLREAEAGAPHDTVRMAAGFRMGIQKAIDLLSEEP